MAKLSSSSVTGDVEFVLPDPLPLPLEVPVVAPVADGAALSVPVTLVIVDTLVPTDSLGVGTAPIEVAEVA